MKKYYIGIIALFVVTLGLGGYVLFKTIDAKQDKQTEKKAQEIATKLNDYVSKNQELPENLDAVGVVDVPSTIKYSKKSEAKYEFCITYKEAKSYSYGGPENILTGSAVKQLSGYDENDDYYSDSSSYESRALYLDYTHKKGENCQTVQPYLYSSYNSRESTITTPKTAQDTERKTDINELHAQIEVYYAANGKYPTTSDLNNATWRATNTKLLDKESLRDPAGSSYSLVSTPYKNNYSYEAKSEAGSTCSATTCASYTLTAYLSDGTTYTKKSLN